MTAVLSRLRDNVRRLEDSKSTFEYQQRLEIERDLFLSARDVAKRHLGIEILGLDHGSKIQIENLDLAIQGRSELVQTVLHAFALKAILSLLASGDSYSTWGLAGSHIPGKKDALKLFIKELEQYVEAVSQLL